MRKLFAVLTMGVVMSGFSLSALNAADEKPKAADRGAQFKRLDKNKDGKLSQEEFLGKRTGEMLERGKKTFTRLDKDSSGDLSLDEFKAGGPKKAK